MGTPPAGLPAADVLVAAAKEAMREGTREDAREALDAYAPAVDELADIAEAAAWLGISTASVYRERSRVRADGKAAWPEPDKTFGRSPAWTYRTLALYRAAMPGRGSAGRGRPRRKATED